MIAADWGGVGIPLYWRLLDNQSGNSATQDRCELLEKIISILGVERIEAIVGDREFIGEKWVSRLQALGVPFCFRFRKSFKLKMANGSTQTASQLLQKKAKVALLDCEVNGCKVNVFLKRLGGGEYLLLMGSLEPARLEKIYKKRWTIEVLFQNFKSRGFNLEATHLRESWKISKLLVFVSLAVAICVKVGYYFDKKLKEVKLKKHGYRAQSIFREGLDIVRETLKRGVTRWNDLWGAALELFGRRLDRMLSTIVIAKNFVG